MLRQQAILTNAEAAAEEREILLALLDLADLRKPCVSVEAEIMSANAEQSRLEFRRLHQEIAILRNSTCCRINTRMRLATRWLSAIVRRVARSLG